MTVSARRWSQLSTFAALATGAVLAVAPAYSTESCEATSGGPEICTTDSGSLLDEGAGVLVPLAVLVLIAAVPVVFPGRRSAMTTAVVLTVLALLGAASIGLFYLPAVILAWLAAAAAGRQRPGRAKSVASS